MIYCVYKSWQKVTFPKNNIYFHLSEFPRTPGMEVLVSKASFFVHECKNSCEHEFSQEMRRQKSCAIGSELLLLLSQLQLHHV